MPIWKVSGEFYARRKSWQSFTKVRDAPTPDAAREWALSVIGGSHHVPRRLIRIGAVEPVSA